MANEKQLRILRRGVDVWNECREKNFIKSIDLSGAYLSNANLSNADLSGVYLSGADLSGANLSGTDLSRANLRGVDFRGADLNGANLSKTILTNVNLNEADLSNANLSGANLSKTILTNVNLNEADLSNANLSGANLSKTILTNVNLNEADLSNANLSGAKFNNATLIHAKLNGAIIKGTDLTRADLSGAFLLRAIFSNAFLRGADLRGTKLRNADLREASFHGVNFSQADLVNSNITGAKLYGTARDDWNINGIKCDYIYWDLEGKARSPKDRNFKPGEFEELYKSLPTVTYYFEDGFTPVDAFVMDRVVLAINEKHSNFDLKLDSFHSRGQPHAVFTVLHKEVGDEALKEITYGYEKKLKIIEGKRQQLLEVVSLLSNKPSQIGNVEKFIMGNEMDINIGTIIGNITNCFNQIEQSNAKDDVKAKLKELSKAVETMVKELPEKKADEVSEGLSTYVKEVVKEEPRKEWYQLTSKGLIEAAKTVNTIGPNVIQTIQEIGTMIGMV